jgi:hypothetical protein
MRIAIYAAAQSICNHLAARFTFLEETWREYLDYQPLMRAYLKITIRHISRRKKFHEK